MSDVKTIRFFVQKEVLDAGVKIVFPVIEGMDNPSVCEEWMNRRKERIQDLLKRYELFDVHEDPVLEGFNILHDRTGVKRRKNIPASENLIRLLKKNHDATSLS